MSLKLEQPKTLIRAIGLDYSVCLLPITAEQVCSLRSEGLTDYDSLRDDYICWGVILDAVFAGEVELDLSHISEGRMDDLIVKRFPALVSVEWCKAEYELAIEEPFDPKKLSLSWNPAVIGDLRYEFAILQYDEEELQFAGGRGGDSELYFIDEGGQSFEVYVDDDETLHLAG